MGKLYLDHSLCIIFSAFLCSMMNPLYVPGRIMNKFCFLFNLRSVSSFLILLEYHFLFHSSVFFGVSSSLIIILTFTNHSEVFLRFYYY